MAPKDDLLAGIASVLPPGGSTTISSSGLDDLFEAYVLTALVQAAKAEHWTVTLEDMSEAPATTALFRRSPGNIYATPGSHNFTHFAFTRAGVPALEGHLGIKV